MSSTGRRRQRQWQVSQKQTDGHGSCLRIRHAKRGLQPFRSLAKLLLTCNSPSAFRALTSGLRILGVVASPARSVLQRSIFRTGTARLAITPKSPLDKEEQEALTGMWSAVMDLDDGLHSWMLEIGSGGQLTAIRPGSINRDNSIIHGSWEASAVRGASSVTLLLNFGPWALSGRGERGAGVVGVDHKSTSLRCTAIAGSVLEGTADPCCVGSFNLTLTSPWVRDDKLAALEAQHQAKVAKRPAPPAMFHFDGFIDLWQLLIALDDKPAPSFYAVRLSADRRFVSEKTPDGVQLGGSWGVWDSGEWLLEAQARKASDPDIALLGTHVWLRVQRRACVGFNFDEDFSLYGQPAVESPEAEIRAREPGGGVADLVDGRVYVGTFGTVGSAEQVGRFTLIRQTDLI